MLVDIGMPGMNGVDTVRGSREQRPDLPVLFATEYADAIGFSDGDIDQNWYSVCNFLAGLSPASLCFSVPRALDIGMGAEWPAGAALAMETWPVRSRG